MMHPYNVLKKKKCPWLDSLTEQVTRSITEYNEFIMAEAEADKCIDFARESFLYERFVDNNFYGMVWCNIEVLKYFVIFFEQKILYNMIGEWKFTTRDKVMYNYFKHTEFSVSRKFVDIITKYRTKAPEFVGDCKEADGWHMTMKDIGINNLRINYVDLYTDQFLSCNDMVRNTKSLGLLRPSVNVFDKSYKVNLYQYLCSCTTGYNTKINLNKLEFN